MTRLSSLMRGHIMALSCEVRLECGSNAVALRLKCGHNAVEVRFKVYFQLFFKKRFRVVKVVLFVVSLSNITIKYFQT